ncbi:MAG: hypothetical protein PHC64_07195, partial [Candidatus Gastranaerophilales bacterium]|nr:hypothetical protein [Candidatus Gastranaerophilales bacterium]
PVKIKVSPTTSVSGSHPSLDGLLFNVEGELVRTTDGSSDMFFNPDLREGFFTNSLAFLVDLFSRQKTRPTT